MVQVAEHCAFGADVAPTPDVLLVGADRGDPLVLHRDLETAHRFAQGAGSEMLSGLRVAHG